MQPNDDPSATPLRNLLAGAAAFSLPLEDILSIHTLLGGLNAALDAGREAEFAEGFIPDALLTYDGGAYRGRERIEDFARDTHRRRSHCARHCENVLIRALNASTAEITGYLITIRLRSDLRRRETPYVLAHASITDRAVKDSGVWQLAERRIFLNSERLPPW